jgi:EF-hand domain-containing protein 1
LLLLLPLQVLRFYGFFKESVVESNIENHRVRKVALYYYLEDDSMHIGEPRQDNSGIPQARGGRGQ